MTSQQHDDIPDNRMPVDKQDGGPGSHTEDGGDTNDVASGGTSEAAHDTDGGHVTNGQDVHGDPDTVA